MTSAWWLVLAGLLIAVGVLMAAAVWRHEPGESDTMPFVGFSGYLTFVGYCLLWPLWMVGLGVAWVMGGWRR